MWPLTAPAQQTLTRHPRLPCPTHAPPPASPPTSASRSSSQPCVRPGRHAYNTLSDHHSQSSASSPSSSSCSSSINSSHSNGSASDGGERAEKPDRTAPQFGVLKMQAIACQLRTQGRRSGVWTIYIAMYLLSAITSTENNSLPVIEPYYLSLFDSHSALSTIGIMTSIALAVGKPPMSKIMDVFGRAEGLALAMLLYMLGALLTSSATSVAQYGVARMAAALGAQGLQLAQMVLVADTSSLASRALLTATITSPWLFTTWVGPILGAWFLKMGEWGYRAIYVLFGIAVPLCAAVLVTVLLAEWRALGRAGAQPHRRRAPGRSLAAEAWAQLDVLGLFLLTIGCAMLLLPLTWRVVGSENWFNMERSLCLGIGAAVLVLFGIYEYRFAKVPVIPIGVVRQRTVLGGSAVGFWHFICQFSYESYFTSFLQVARFTSARDAQYIQQSYLFTACISAIICGILVKWTQRYKVWVIVGIGLHGVGAAMMVRSRRLDTSMAEIVLSQIIGGFGGGFTTLGAQLGVQAVVGPAEVGMATAVFLTITQIGGAVGASLAGRVWNGRLAAALARRLPLAEQVHIPKIIGDLRFTLAYSGENRARINEAYVDVQLILNWIGLLALVPCMLCGLWMENVDLGAAGAREQENARRMRKGVGERGTEEGVMDGEERQLQDQDESLIGECSRLLD